MAVATKAAVAGGAGLVLVVVIVVIVVVLLQLQKQTPAPPIVAQTPGPSPAPAPAPAPAQEPTPSPTPVPVYSGPQSSLSQPGLAQAPAIQQVGLTAPPAEQGQVAALLDSLPDILTSIGIGLAVEALLHADVIARKILTRAIMTPAIRAELKLARAAVAERTLMGRMSKAFGRMGILARAKMGMRWGKTATQLGETAAASKLRAATEAAARNADNGAQMMAREIAEREAKSGALSSVARVFDAAAIVGLVLDMTNTGNYTELISTEDMRNMKAANDSEVVNTTIACSTWPIGAGCPQSASPAPAPAPGPAPPPRDGRYPMFVGPLDEWDTDMIDLAIYNEFSKIFTSENPPQSVKNLVADVSSRISSDLEVDSIDDFTFLTNFNLYMTPVELYNLHTMAFDNICESEGGVGFLPGNGYEKACSYSSKDTCHAAYPWPPASSDDTKDLTYTEWRAKPWFSQWNTIEPTNIPAAGACIAADTSIHQMCDEEIRTATDRANNRYIRETGECVNTRDVCRVKGVTYRDSDPPTCYVTEGQTIAELIFGSTLVRFFVSGGKLSLDPDIITTVVSISVPTVNASVAVSINQVNSGNDVVDTAVNTVTSGLSTATNEIANAGIVAVNTVSSGLASASSEIANAGITAANAIQTGVIQTVNDVVNSAVSGVNAIISGVTNMPSAESASAGLLNPNSGNQCPSGKVSIIFGDRRQACCDPGEIFIQEGPTYGHCECPPNTFKTNGVCRACDESNGEFPYNGTCITKAQCPACSLNQVLTDVPKSCECVCPTGKFKYTGQSLPYRDTFNNTIPLYKCITQSECPELPGNGYEFAGANVCDIRCSDGKTYIRTPTTVLVPPTERGNAWASLGANPDTSLIQNQPQYWWWVNFSGNAPAGCYSSVQAQTQAAQADYVAKTPARLIAMAAANATFVCPDGKTFNSTTKLCECNDFSWTDPTTGLQSCYRCLPGSYLNKQTTNTCVACPINTYQPKFNNDESCKPCPSGTSTAYQTGADFESLCRAPAPARLPPDPSCPLTCTGTDLEIAKNAFPAIALKQPGEGGLGLGVAEITPTGATKFDDRTCDISYNLKYNIYTSPGGFFSGWNNAVERRRFTYILSGCDKKVDRIVSTNEPPPPPTRELCPAGQGYDTSTNLCKVCVGPTYLNPETGICDRCPGSQVPNSDHTACVNCPTVEKPNAAGTACEARCQAGYTFQAWFGCQPCPLNQISNRQTNTCETCPPDKHANSDRTACETCPSGQGWNSTTKVCESCTGNEYLNTWATACVDCGATAYPKSDRTGCIQCPVGQKLNSSKTGCETCPSGQTFVVWPSGFTGCHICEQNTYESNGACIMCPTGTASSPGSSGASSCSAITFPGYITVFDQQETATTFGDDTKPDLYNVLRTFTSRDAALQFCDATETCNYIVYDGFEQNFKAVTVIRNSDIRPRAATKQRIRGVWSTIYKKLEPVITGFSMVYRNDSTTTLITPPTQTMLGNSDGTSTNLGSAYIYYNGGYDGISTLALGLSTCNYLIVSRLDSNVFFFNNLNPSDIGTSRTGYQQLVYVYKKNP